MMEERYSRQVRFTPIGKKGQENLRKSHVLIIGAGALGASSAEMLARAGVGEISILDRDYVDWSNLQRQTLYTEQDVQEALPKAIAAKRALKAINRMITIHSYVMDATPEKIEPLLPSVDIILDATDNFETRFMMNDLAVKHQIPWIYGACVGSYGMTYTVIPDETPCFHCLMNQFQPNNQTETCDTVGIISPTVQIVTAEQVAETLKYLVGAKEQMRKEVFSFDVWKNEYVMLKVNKLKRTDCPTCGTKVFPYLQQKHLTKTEALCGRNTVQIRPPKPIERNLSKLSELFTLLEYKVRLNPFLLSVELEKYRIVAFKDGRVFIHGTNDITEAKTVYSQYFA